ncbi:MAG: DUF6615 family protein [Phycisphaerales bacterium]
MFVKRYSLCETAYYSDNYIADWLKLQSETQEETLTEWLLFNLLRFADVQIYTRLFNKREEGGWSGADFDMWCEFEGFHFRVRMQSKKLTRGKDHYASLSHCNRSGFQIDMLMKSSARGKFLPLYLFFAQQEKCGQCSIMENNFSHSIFVRSANSVHGLLFSSGRTKIDQKTALNDATAWQHLWCEQLFSSKRVTLNEFRQSVEGKFVRIGGHDASYEPTEYIGRTSTGVHEGGVPELVHRVLGGEDEDVEAYRGEYGLTKAVMLINLSE